VEFHGANYNRTGLFVKMLGGVEDGVYTPLSALWEIPLSDLHTVYFW
jgi:hypothetical protein